MKIFYKALFAFIFTFSLLAASAQNNVWPVRFANGNFVTGNNIEKNTFKKEEISNTLWGDTYFVLVQFSILPSTAMQQKLKDAGIELNNYLPEHTYLAAIKNTFDFSKAKSFNIISINSIPSFYKIHKRLANYKPSFNKDEQEAIAVNYFEQADKAMVVSTLQSKGAIIITEKFAAASLILIQYNKAIVDSLAALPFVSSLGLQPIKDQLLNYDSRAAHAVSGLNAWGGKNLNGKGVTIGIGDNADASTHIDFSGRMINRSPATPTNHGTHTTGTAAGAGIINPKHRGMASKATIVNQYFSDVIVYAPSYITDYDMVVTNNSYHTANAGCVGNQEYNSLSRYGDLQMKAYNELQHVFASGNDGASTCSPYPSSFATIKSGWQCA
ncbi:MAG: S8 family serine peptidase, partial [Bacteroidota bacterium]